MVIKSLLQKKKENDCKTRVFFKHGGYTRRDCLPVSCIRKPDRLLETTFHPEGLETGQRDKAFP
jgi:hypothetical protein